MPPCEVFTVLQLLDFVPITHATSCFALLSHISSLRCRYSLYLMRFEIFHGETEHISFRGPRKRNPTVLIRVGKISVSQKAFILGTALVICQMLDGLLTYLGLRIFGISMEGNAFLRELMNAYGTAPVLFAVKLFAIAVVVLLTFQAHRRRWIRPLIFFVVAVYVCLAVLPWIYIISGHLARQQMG